MPDDKACSFHLFFKVTAGQKLYERCKAKNSGDQCDGPEVWTGILQTGSIADKNSAWLQHIENLLYRIFRVTQQMQDIQSQDCIERLLPALNIIKCGNLKTKVITYIIRLSFAGDINHPWGCIRRQITADSGGVNSCG